jgi:hypothetical protein
MLPQPLSLECILRCASGRLWASGKTMVPVAICPARPRYCGDVRHSFCKRGSHPSQRAILEPAGALGAPAASRYAGPLSRPGIPRTALTALTSSQRTPRGPTRMARADPPDAPLPPLKAPCLQSTPQAAARPGRARRTARLRLGACEAGPQQAAFSRAAYSRPHMQAPVARLPGPPYKVYCWSTLWDGAAARFWGAALKDELPIQLHTEQAGNAQ